VYKEYARRRPSDCSGPDSRFYLKPHDNPTPDVWFTRQPIGKNAIGFIAKKMAIEANLPSVNKTNHSARKMAIQTLLHAGIPPTDVIQLTDHKNVQSLNSYSHLSIDQQHGISNLLTTELSESTVLSEESAAAKDPAISTMSAHFPSNGNSLAHIGIDDVEIMSILSEPFDDELLPPSNEQACVKRLEKRLPLLPCTSRAHNNFLNGNIYGNITININTKPAKRRRADNDEDSEE
jgi:hypothetical protein